MIPMLPHEQRLMRGIYGTVTVGDEMLIAAAQPPPPIIAQCAPGVLDDAVSLVLEVHGTNVIARRAKVGEEGIPLIVRTEAQTEHARRFNKLVDSGFNYTATIERLAADPLMMVSRPLTGRLRKRMRS